MELFAPYGCGCFRPHPGPLPGGLTVSHILFAGHRGFRHILQKTDDHESTFSASHSHRESHSIPTASGLAASGSRFDALPLCVFASLRYKRRRFQRKDAETQRGRGQEAVDWIGRPRAIAENRSARLLTDEPWTASRWRERGWAVLASANGHVIGGSFPSLCRYP